MYLRSTFVFLSTFGILASSLAYPQGIPIMYYDPIQGPICAGPLGPGPCAVVAQWIATHPSYGGIPIQPSVQTVFPTQPGFQPPPGQIPVMPDPAGGPGIPFQPLQASIVANTVDGAAQCAQMTRQSQQPNVDTFLTCTRGALVLNKDSAVLVGCAEQAGGDKAKLATCAGSSIIGSKLSEDQKKALDCARENSDDGNAFSGCIANGLIESNLNSQQREVLDCAFNNDVDSRAFAGCAAKAFYGDKINPEAQAAVDCALESQGDTSQFATCAVNKFAGLNLNPEQQIAVKCVVTTGGQPYAAAACTASGLTIRELEKCTQGIGGDGCFGDNNDLVGKHGWVVRNIAGLGGGPNSIINNPGQLLNWTGGPNSVFNNPAQLLGGPQSVPNVILHNVPSPPPIQLGNIGGHRVCIPWC